MSASGSNSVASNGQSRLVQPSRLSFVAAPAVTSKLSSPSTFGGAAFQNSSCSSAARASLSSLSSPSSSNAIQRTMDGQNCWSLQASNELHQTILLSPPPNANTSGLPAPRQRQSGLLSLEPLAAGAGAGIPSTIGSALKRRQPSPVVPNKTPNSRLPASSAASPVGQPMPGESDGHAASSPCSIRRSHSQKPAGTAYYGSPAQHLDNRPVAFRPTFPAHLKTTASAIAAKQRENLSAEEQDELATAGSKCVESLPPLKSTTYISRLISANTKVDNQSHQQDPKSEPIISATAPASKLLKPNALNTAKPSQLVKPLVTTATAAITRGAVGVKKSKQHSSISSSVESCKFGNTVGSNYASQRIGGNRASSFFASTSARSIHNQKSNVTSKSLQDSNQLIGLRAPKNSRLQQATAGRRLSLQPNGFIANQVNCGKLEQASEGEQEESLSEDGEATSEDAETGDDDDGDDEEDDATTATTMTQMSDSNIMLTSADQEFNNMIQMLSSSAILGDSETKSSQENKTISELNGGTTTAANNATDDSLNSASSTSYENDFKKNNKSNEESPQDSQSGSQLPKVKATKLLKSQSLSFGSKQFAGHEKSSAFNEKNMKPMGKLTTLATVGPTYQASSRAQRGQNGVKLPRPRSRIIFDPTSSQFHVSCTTEDADPTNGLSSSGETSPLELDEGRGELSAAATRSISHDDQDEASLKLLDEAQNKIITLKYLPTTNSSAAREQEQAGEVEDSEQETIRLLKDCRGSLESLLMNGHHREFSTPKTRAPINESRESQRKSPVGSALRSLFGRSASQQTPGYKEVPPKAANHFDSPTTTTNKTATVVRHSSLRTEPRAFEGFLAERKCKLDQQQSPSEAPKSNPATSKPPQQSAQQSTTTTTTTSNLLGSELLQRASKKLSASSSSLTSKFKFISSSSSLSPSATNTANPSSQPLAPVDGGSEAKAAQQARLTSRHLAATSNKFGVSIQTAYPRNAGLPPKMPSYDTRPGYLGNSPLNGSSAHPSINETNSLGKDVVDYRENSGFENDLDTTILSDTSTLHEDNTIFMNKCAELERTVESLKNKLIGKEKELTDLQLKQWSSDYLIDQLKSTISRLEKENSQLRTVVAHRVNL